jgi:hypothetical protein
LWWWCCGGVVVVVWRLFFGVVWWWWCWCGDVGVFVLCLCGGCRAVVMVVVAVMLL